MTKLLFPLALLYDAITRLRNLLYERGWKAGHPTAVPSIGVGNLTVGGTGKTPHIEYLIRLLHPHFHLATLSRGYGRKTKGFRWAKPDTTAEEIGDEPMQFYHKFGAKGLRVAVGEKRVPAARQIVQDVPELDFLLLDDVFQHRAIQPHLLLLLSDYNRPFYQDFLLPAGRLREARKGAKRADALVITKCPPELSEAEREQIRSKVAPYLKPNTPVFFTSIRYGRRQPLSEQGIEGKTPLFVVTGIANTQALEKHLKENFEVLDWLRFPDHHHYTLREMENIRKRLEKHQKRHPLLLTTEKDAMKWLAPALKRSLKGVPAAYLPIEVYFLEDGFDDWLTEKFPTQLRK